MRPDEIVVGGVYRVKGWKRPRTVTEISEDGLYARHQAPQAWGCTETPLDDFASWATERIGGEGK